MIKHVVAFASLFTSVGTLLCCALPALFVTLGAGATFAGLSNAFPQLIWIGMHKTLVFSLGGGFLLLGFGMMRLFSPPPVCELDDSNCETTRSWSQPLLYISLALYSIGAFFAYVAPHIL